jgi:hypothetical protein
MNALKAAQEETKRLKTTNLNSLEDLKADIDTYLWEDYDSVEVDEQCTAYDKKGVLTPLPITALVNKVIKDLEGYYQDEYSDYLSGHDSKSFYPIFIKNRGAVRKIVQKRLRDFRDWAVYEEGGYLPPYRVKEVRGGAGNDESGQRGRVLEKRGDWLTLDISEYGGQAGNDRNRIRI